MANCKSVRLSMSMYAEGIRHILYHLFSPLKSLLRLVPTIPGKYYKSACLFFFSVVFMFPSNLFPLESTLNFWVEHSTRRWRRWMPFQWVSIAMGDPLKNGWVLTENPNLKWMMTGGTSILGNLHLLMNNYFHLLIIITLQ